MNKIKTISILGLVVVIGGVFIMGNSTISSPTEQVGQTFDSSATNLILRHPTGGLVAYAIFDLGNGSTEQVKISNKDKLKYDSLGYDAIKPTTESQFLLAVGGVPELDTTDGYAHPGDAYESNGELIVVTEEGIGFEYSFSQASDPKDGSSDLASKKYSSTGHRIVLTNYDLSNLPDLAVDPNTKESTLVEAGAVVAKTVLTANFEESVEQSPNHHSVTFDAQSSGSGYTSGTTLTINHTIASQPNRHISIVDAFADGGGQTISGITYAGSNATLATTTDSSTSRQGDLFYLLNPPVGASSYTITQTGTANTLAGGAWSVYGADQSTAYTAMATAGATTGTSGVVTVGSLAGDLVISITWHRNQNITPDAAWTSDWNLTTAGALRFAGSHISGASPNVTRTDTFANGEWGMIAASIKASGERLQIKGGGEIRPWNTTIKIRS